MDTSGPRSKASLDKFYGLLYDKISSLMTYYEKTILLEYISLTEKQFFKKYQAIFAQDPKQYFSNYITLLRHVQFYADYQLSYIKNMVKRIKTYFEGKQEQYRHIIQQVVPSKGAVHLEILKAMENYDELLTVSEMPLFKEHCLLVYDICTQIKQLLSQPQDIATKKIKQEIPKENKRILLCPVQAKEQIARLRLDSQLAECLLTQLRPLCQDHEVLLKRQLDPDRAQVTLQHKKSQMVLRAMVGPSQVVLLECLHYWSLLERIQSDRVAQMDQLVAHWQALMGN